MPELGEVMVTGDLFLRIVGADKSVSYDYRRWYTAPDRLLQAIQEAYFKERATVEVITQAQYRSATWPKAREKS
jgi:hypothetical protein